MTADRIQEKLDKLAAGNEKYRDFNSRIVNDLDGVEFIGVRIPDLRKIAKEIAENDWQKFLKNNDWSIYEMKQIAFLLPGYLKKLSIDEFFAVIDVLALHASSWANCDALGIELSYDDEEVWLKIKKYLDSKNGWIVRIGLNFVFANYLNEKNIGRVIDEIIKINARYRESTKRGTLDYYVKMMLAWTLAEMAIKHRAIVEEILPKLDFETTKYTRQKMRDSFHIK